MFPISDFSAIIVSVLAILPGVLGLRFSAIFASVLAILPGVPGLRLSVKLWAFSQFYRVFQASDSSDYHRTYLAYTSHRRHHRTLNIINFPTNCIIAFAIQLYASIAYHTACFYLYYCKYSSLINYWLHYELYFLRIPLDRTPGTTSTYPRAKDEPKSTIVKTHRFNNSKYT